MKLLFKKITPAFVFSAYHWFLSLFFSWWHGRPSKDMIVIGVTGTNGKTSVIEFVSKILNEAGIRAASVSSLYFNVGGVREKNNFKMTMPGRGFLQKFLARAKKEGATHAVLEVTSEGIKQFRHKGIDWDVLVFTNLTPEHIESHGSFDAYKKTKEKVFAILSKTRKKPGTSKTIIVNRDDPNSEIFLKHRADKKIEYSRKDSEGVRTKLIGDFNLSNISAALKVAEVLGIEPAIARRAIEKIESIPGRMEFVQREPFAVVVDYAHTPDALRKVYAGLSAKSKEQNAKLICVLGSAGGGRDKSKRKEMGGIAGEFCGRIILTNEDPYDEDPETILQDIESGIENYKSGSLFKILDRREAIKKAIQDAKEGDVVIITGKGAEPWIMGPGGKKTPWDDREVVRETSLSN